VQKPPRNSLTCLCGCNQHNESALASSALTTCTHPHIEPMRNDYHYSVCQAESNLVDLPFVLVAVGRACKLQLYSTAGFSCRLGQIAAHLSVSIIAHMSIMNGLIHFEINDLIRALLNQSSNWSINYSCCVYEF
jgi:hypothetical protein